MSSKFFGTLKELSKIIKSSDYLGAWDKSAQGNKRVFNFNNGAILNWWKSSGTISFQGKPETREEVQAVLEPLLISKIEEPSSRTSRNEVWWR